MPTLNLKQVNDPNFVRTYITPAGIFPSVTSVLSTVKHLEGGSDYLTAWKDRIGHGNAKKIVENAANAGTYMHKCVENFILGGEIEFNKDYAFLTNNIIKYINNISTVYLTEGYMYSDKLGVAGSTDLCCDYKGELSIVDFKNSRRVRTDESNHSYYIQETIYALMYYERYGKFPEKIVTLVAINSKVSPIKTQEFIKSTRDYIPEVIDIFKKFRETDVFRKIQEMNDVYITQQP